jgi:DNA-binding beta-propeller fold protein YncE
MKGERLWEYKDVSLLNGPRSVTVDNQYNTYVTSFTSNAVVVVEPDGRQGRQLISSDDGLNGPAGIYFVKSKNSLLVTNYDGLAFLYDMF